MSTVAQMAQEFSKGNGKKLSHRSVVLRYPLGAPNEYLLHNNIIAQFDPNNRSLSLHWCGWYSPTTANHMNAILRAFGIAQSVSYAQARDSGTGSVIFSV